MKLRDLACITCFLWVSVLLSVKWKSYLTDRAVVMISEVLLCCSILTSAIGNIINDPHHSETGTAVLFLQMPFPNFILMPFRSLLLNIWFEDQEYPPH